MKEFIITYRVLWGMPTRSESAGGPGGMVHPQTMTGAFSGKTAKAAIAECRGTNGVPVEIISMQQVV